MRSEIDWWRAAISVLISGLVLAALVLLALGAWYVVIQAMIYATTLGAGHHGSMLPWQEGGNASALSTDMADRVRRAVT